MSKKRKIEVITEMGTFTRTTARDYAYIILANDERGWGALSWTSRIDLARKAKRQYESWKQWDRVEILEIETRELVK